VEVQKTLKQLVEDLDSERLADISASTEILEDVARQIRRRGRMEPTDWDRVVEVEHELRSALKQAQWSLAALMRKFPEARSRHERADALQEVFGGERLDHWLTVFVESQLARTRWDLLFLLREASQHPESLGNLERTTRDAIATRQREIATVGRALRELADPSARVWWDHLQQHSHFKLRRDRKVVHALLERHGPVLSERSAL